MHMENQYKRTTTTVSFINYHFVFCPRFRRKIFDIPGVEERHRNPGDGMNILGSALSQVRSELRAMEGATSQE